MYLYFRAYITFKTRGEAKKCVEDTKDMTVEDRKVRMELFGKVDCTVKPVLNSHSKIDKTKVLKTDYPLMQVKSIAECSPTRCKNYQVCTNDESRLTLTYFMARSNLIPNAFIWRKF